MTAAINTLAIAKRLKSAGASQKLAQETADILNDVIEDKVATKHDLREQELRLKMFVLQSNLATAGLLGAFLTLVKYFG